MKRYQKRNRTGLAKERVIMAATAVFVLAALTLTGVYVRDINKKNNDGYVVDFGAMEENVAQKAADIRRNEQERRRIASPAPKSPEIMPEQAVTADDLDFDPYFQEANSHQVENYEPTDITGVLNEVASTDLAVGEAVMAAEDMAGTEKAEEVGQASDAEADTVQDTSGTAQSDENNTETINPDEAQNTSGTATAAEGQDNSAVTASGEVKNDSARANSEEAKKAVPEDIPAISTAMQSALTFTDNDPLVWPIVGNVLINYSMDKTVYFPTLQQYKYNPAIIIQATEGEIISAAAAGKVTSVFADAQIGNGITMELGNGYELTYGQLDNILVSEGSFVAAGDVVAEVAAPTKYYSVEGTNVYFKLTRDGKAVNPMTKLGQD